MNILFTGARGFLGRELIPRLKNDGHAVWESTRTNLNPLNIDRLESFLKSVEIDLVIHAATEGGSRTKLDDLRVLANNLGMFANLLSLKSLYGRMFTFSSGADFSRENSISSKSEEDIFSSFPVDFYGRSKNIIARTVSSQETNIYNFRLFGCFGPFEDDSRFIKRCLDVNLREIEIQEDILMDYFYVGDLYRVLQHYMVSKEDLPFDLNLVYDEKLKLSEIAQIAFHTSQRHLQVCNSGSSKNEYTGNGSLLSSLSIPLDGLRVGIQKMHKELNNDRP